MEEIYWIHDNYYRLMDSVHPYAIPKILQNKKSLNNQNYGVKWNTIPKIIFKIIVGIFLSIKKKPDAIVSILFTPHGIIGFFLSKFFNIPWIHTIIAGDRELNIHGSFWRKQFTKMVTNATYITVTGENTKRYLISQGIISDKIILLPNVINMKLFSPMRHEKKFDIIAITRLFNIKRIDRLIMIIEIVRKEIPEISLAIIGDGPEKDELIKIVLQKDMSENIVFIDKLPYEDVPDAWNMGKVFALTSDGEGVPLTLLEAMASGVVCVVPAVGDIESVIDNNVNGILIENPENIKQFGDAIIDVLSDEIKYSKLSNNAMKVRSIFSYDNASLIWEGMLSQCKD